MKNKERTGYQHQIEYEQNRMLYEQRIQFLDSLILELESYKHDFPEGNLRISKSGKKVQYYHITDKENMNGCYIRKDNLGLAKELAERDYLNILMREAKRESKALKKFIKGMSGVRVEEVYEELNEYRKELVKPFIQSDRLFVNEWLDEKYDGNPFSVEERVYETKRGEKVRSKSEVLLADMYYEMGIPYKYEYPAKMFNGKIRYPDFVLLKMPERKLIYHEHLGLLEEKEYRHNNLIKINEYAKSGIRMGDNLIITFETEYAPLILSDVKNVVRNIFKK